MGVKDNGLTAMTTKLGSSLWVGVGTGTGDFDDTDRNTMFTELVRVAVVTYNPTLTYLEVEAALSVAQGVGTLTEIAVFDAAASGNMWCHAAISPADVKTATEGRVLTVRIPFARQT